MKSLLIGQLIILLTFIVQPAFAQKTIYVDIDATGNNDGTSWANAYTSLQAAITDGDANSPAEIWVAEGTYKPGSSQSSYFEMKNLVEIYGGFDGTETDLSQRDFNTHITVLSGEIGNAGIDDNINNIIKNFFTQGSPLGSSAILDGFTLTRGGSWNGSNYNSNGSAIYNYYASPIIRNCQFKDNNSLRGGAVYNYNSSATYINCTFSNNVAGQRGGAAENNSNDGNPTVSFVNSLFYGNWVNYGLGDGAAIMSGSSTTTTKILNCLFYSNTCSGCTNPSGAVRLGGAMIDVENTIIWGNDGPEIYVSATASNINNNIIDGGFSGGTNIIEEAPVFLDAPNNDFRSPFCSPGINKGSNSNISGYSEDLDQNPRIVGGIADIGPYEFQNGIELVTTDATCVSGSDGSLSITVIGGSYEYSLDGLTFSSSTSYTSLPPDDYDLYIKDLANNCTSVQSFTISAPNLTLSASTTDATCSQSSDGIITLTATASNGPVTYSIDGSSYFSSGTFNSLLSGDYTAYAQDATSCVLSMDVTLGPSPFPNSYTKTDITCNGDDDGEIVFNTIGGNGPYEFSIDGGVTFTMIETFSNLASGTYDIQTKNGIGCYSAIEQVTINEPGVLAGLYTPTDITCFGEDNGRIEVGITGGTAPYKLQINSGGYTLLSGSDSTIINLTAGNYTIDIVDENACTTSSSTITIAEPNALTTTVSSTDVTSCTGNDGTISIAVTGGTSPYQYSLDSGSTFTSGSTYSGTSLSPGVYGVLFEDANGCQTFASDTISNPFAYTISAIVTNATCFGGSDGTVTISTSGGSSPFTYSLDGTTYQSSNVFNVAAGNYTYYAKDNTGCVSFDAISVSEPSQITMSLTQTADVKCNGDQNAAVKINASGGTGGFTYSLDNVTFSANDSITGLGAGNYTVYVKDANDCVASDNITITEPGVLSISMTPFEDNLCFGDQAASITMMASGGTTPYKYSIDGITYTTNPDFENYGAGMYTIYVEDANGCEASSQITITEPDELVATLSVSAGITCFGESDGEITVTASGGTGTKEYSLDGTIFQSSNIFSGLSEGKYGITTQDANLCARTDSLEITAPTLLRLGLTPTNISCKGAADGALIAVPSGGSAPYEYSINSGAFGSNDTFSPLAPGTYTVEVRDANGCTFSLSATLAEPDELAVSVNQTSNSDFEITATGGTAPYEYSADGLTFQSGNTFTGLGADTYTFIVQDANGCTVESGEFSVVLGLRPLPEGASIYPNPIKGELFVRGIRFDRLSVMTLAGKEVLASGFQEKFDLSELNSGLYVLRLIDTQEGLTYTQKIFKE